MRTRWFIPAAAALLMSGLLSAVGAAASASQVTSLAQGPCGQVASAPSTST